MADSGANSCMVASDKYLIGCHDIKPITLGLALKVDETEQKCKCSRMGYLPMQRDNGHVHHQPCLINDQATDSIMSPEAIMHACSAFVHWRQEGFVDSTHGTLQFFGINDTLLLTLRLVKRNGLYFCPIESFLNTDGRQQTGSAHPHHLTSVKIPIDNGKFASTLLMGKCDIV